MASIGSLSSATSSLVSGSGGLHGYGGLASGLDRDTLIESMTYATRAKIAKQQQKKQTLEWKQDAYRSVTDKLVALSSKYMDYTNPTTNLTNSSFFSKTNIVSYGVNASKVSIASNGSGLADSLTILGVKQMAKNASATSAQMVSDSTLKTDDINFAKENVSVFQDQSLQIKYGDKTYTVNFGEIADPTNVSKVAEQLNAALKNVKIGEGEDENLGNYVTFDGNSGNGITLKKTTAAPVEVTGGSEKLLESMGLVKDEDGKPVDEEKWIVGSSGISISATDIFDEVDFKDRIAGQSLTFTYNGKEITINMPSADDLKASTETGAAEANKNAVLDALQKGFDKAVGAGRIKVDVTPETLGEDGKASFTFKTTLPDSGDDTSSVLTLSYGSSGMVGANRAFHVLAGENNRLNMNVSLENSGLNGVNSLTADANGELALKINNVDIEGITKNSSINDIINAINKSDAGVKVTYLSNSDKFTIQSTVEGASGEINISTADGSLAALLFGPKDINEKGQDAIVTVQYEGSSEEIDLVRSSNTFTQDGLNITVKGEFGFTKTTNDEGKEVYTREVGQEVTFESTANVDSIMSAIKDMVAAYNEVVDLVNSLVSTKPDRSYAPLTDDQKEEMTEDQIEKWEKKAKEGILFGDDLLRNLSTDLRFVAGGSLMNQLEAIGISEASGYTSNGKLTIDETKLRNALETDPDNVGNLFTNSNNGLMTNLKKVTDSYAKTWGTKGSLIARAGAEASATSLTDNEIYTSMKDIDDIIAQLQERLKSEQDRYISQFTTLETLIAQMNSQSSYLSSMTGGY